MARLKIGHAPGLSTRVADPVIPSTLHHLAILAVSLIIPQSAQISSVRQPLGLTPHLGLLLQIQPLDTVTSTSNRLACVPNQVELTPLILHKQAPHVAIGPLDRILDAQVGPTQLASPTIRHQPLLASLLLPLTFPCAVNGTPQRQETRLDPAALISQHLLRVAGQRKLPLARMFTPGFVTQHILETTTGRQPRHNNRRLNLRREHLPPAAWLTQELAVGISSTDAGQQVLLAMAHAPHILQIRSVS